MKMRYFAMLLLSAVLLTGCGGGTSTKMALLRSRLRQKVKKNRPCRFDEYAELFLYCG